MIYLASPYTHPNDAIRHMRYRATRASLIEMTLQGDIVYSPIVAWHELSQENQLPTDWKYWRAHNDSHLKGADMLRVLVMPGLFGPGGELLSRGVLHEVSFASVHGIPIEWWDKPMDTPAWRFLENGA